MLSLTMWGILLRCVSLAYLRLILDRSVVGTTWSWVLVTGCLVPADFGTYLGRYLRFNRWDAITRPGRVLADTGRYVGGGRRMAEALAYTLAFGTVTLASSIPATSANVVRVPSPSTRRARHQHDGQHVEVVRGA